MNYIIIVIVVISVGSASAANILGIYYHAGKSHHILGEMLLKQLARKGHNVTMASPFPLKEPFPNYTDIHLTGILEDQQSREYMFMEMNEGGFLSGAFNVMDLTKTQTELTLNHTEMTKLVKSGTKFDVIIIDWFLNQAILIFGKLLDAPVIPIASYGTTFLASAIIGNSAPPAYIPSGILDFPSNMSFMQRTVNSLAYLGFQAISPRYARLHEGLIKKHWNITITQEELRNSVALILSNGHYSFESPRPFLPNIIPIGGFHIQAVKELPTNLQTFMDRATEGVIYFSLGSQVKSTSLPKVKQQHILKAFSRLKQKVLLKWEEGHMEGKPDNVLLNAWFPQNDILAHPNLKMFITHGGLLSTIEAIHHGVPVIGIPICNDQKSNVLTAVRNGYAILINLDELNEETLFGAIQEILNNSKYAANVKKRSILLRDQPLSPMDTAVFWVEHVIRHKGGAHLQNSGVYLSWYQYMLLDVALFVIVLLATVLVCSYLIIKKVVKLFRYCIWKFIWSNKSKDDTKDKNS